MRNILLLLKLLVLACALTVVHASNAQFQRLLPPNAKRGITGEQRPLPAVIINGKPVKMAPGGIIFDEQNRTLLHQNLPTNTAVLFQLDMNGDIQRIYVLTPEERARLDQAKK
jgi:hypothetical protein